MRTHEFANKLRRTNGYDHALKIAQSCYKGSSPSEWHNIPKGQVFFVDDPRKSVGLNEKYLRRVHGFWTEVYHILKKMKD